MTRKTKPHKAILLLEVAIVILVTTVIALFLFRGYGIFIHAQKKSSGYLQLSLESERQLWQLRSGVTDNAVIVVSATEFNGLKQVVLKTYFPQDRDHQGVYFDTVTFMPLEEK